MMLKFANFSDKGFSHEVNQDSLLEPTEKNGRTLFAIADGLGGKPGGEIASRLAIDSLRNHFSSNEAATIDSLVLAVKSAFDEYESSANQYKNMATTLTFCLCYSETVLIGHIGDSRAFHLRGAGIMYRTKDQTELQKLLDEGILTKSQAKVYPRKNVLLSALSSNGEFEVYKSEFSILPGDRIILMTDGAYNSITLKALSDLSQKSNQLTELLSTIHDLVSETKPSDDFSCLAVEYLNM